MEISANVSFDKLENYDRQPLDSTQEGSYLPLCSELSCYKRANTMLYGSAGIHNITVFPRCPLCHEHANDIRIAETEKEKE